MMNPIRNVALLTLLVLGTFVRTSHSLHPASPSRRRLRSRQVVVPKDDTVSDGQEQEQKPIESTRSLQERCILSDNFYGNFIGINRNVEFRYQGVFTPGTSQAQINANILPFLERDIVQGILPSFFDCPGTDPIGLVNAISPSAQDELSVGGKFFCGFPPNFRRCVGNFQFTQL